MCVLDNHRARIKRSKDRIMNKAAASLGHELMVIPLIDPST
jgi:hypothetical protein